MVTVEVGGLCRGDRIHARYFGHLGPGLSM